MDADWVSAWAAVTQTVLGVVGALFVWHEYEDHKKSRRADLAATLKAAFDSDELIAFAVTSLDWGGGLVIAPESWRDLLTERLPRYDRTIIEDALSPALTQSTARDPLRMLYRMAFVRLFNHLEVIAMHVRRDEALLDELEAVADLARRLSRPRYVSEGLYERTLAAWYPPDVWALVERLDRNFPERAA